MCTSGPAAASSAAVCVRERERERASEREREREKERESERKRERGCACVSSRESLSDACAGWIPRPCPDQVPRAHTHRERDAREGTCGTLPRGHWGENTGRAGRARPGIEHPSRAHARARARRREEDLLVSLDGLFSGGDVHEGGEDVDDAAAQDGAGKGRHEAKVAQHHRHARREQEHRNLRACPARHCSCLVLSCLVLPHSCPADHLPCAACSTAALSLSHVCAQARQGAGEPRHLWLLVSTDAF